MSTTTPSSDATPEPGNLRVIRDAFVQFARERFGEDVRIDAEALLGMGRKAG